MVPSRVHRTNANEDSSGKQKVELQMITHKSRRYTSNGSDGAINTVFRNYVFEASIRFED